MTHNTNGKPQEYRRQQRMACSPSAPRVHVALAYPHLQTYVRALFCCLPHPQRALPCTEQSAAASILATSAAAASPSTSPSASKYRLPHLHRAV
mmetsp:Transcript_11627/g.31700  ORF Transcript_11627/g.31700 Transcript_11627/m.31700 type:complete len:94 (+) Transcript_11627:448-729(+)|eukprot:1159359-Pelagomonas_calceolata.AAC.3